MGKATHGARHMTSYRASNALVSPNTERNYSACIFRPPRILCMRSFRYYYFCGCFSRVLLPFRERTPRATTISPKNPCKQTRKRFEQDIPAELYGHVIVPNKQTSNRVNILLVDLYTTTSENVMLVRVSTPIHKRSLHSGYIGAYCY